MADYYVEPETGGGSPAGAGTEADPWNGFGNITGLVNGDTLYLTAGTFTEQLLVTGVDVDIIGAGAGVTIIDGEDTRESACTLSSVGGTISNITFTKGSRYGLLISNETANFDPYKTKVRDCVASFCRTNFATVGYAVGFQVDNVNNVISTITYENCIAHDNGRMGWDVQQMQGTLIRSRCTAHDNGDLYTGGGFFSHGWRTTKNTGTGWTSEGGNVWSRARDSGLDGFGGGRNDTDNDIFKVPATPTATPNAGEMSLFGGTLYLRLRDDADPNTKSITFSRSNLTIIDTDLEAYDNGGYDAEHGTGIQYDDFSANITARGLKVYNNTGRGLYTYQAYNADIAGVYAYGNGTYVGATGNQQANITLVGWDIELNNVTSTDATVAVSGGQGSQTIRNLISDNCTTVLRGDNGTTMGATLTVDYYIYNGQTTIESENNSAVVTPTNGTAADPALNDNGSLGINSPAASVGTQWWSGDPLRDVNGETFRLPPAVGAFNPNEGAVLSGMKPAWADRSRANLSG